MPRITANKHAGKQGMDFMALLKACAKDKDVNKVARIHDEIKEQGILEKNPCLGSALIKIYSRCGALDKAYKVFVELPLRDVVSWCAIIGGYTIGGKGQQALVFFEHMLNDGVPPDAITFVCALKACGSVVDIDMGRKIHKMILDRKMLGKDIVLGTALMDMYAKCGELEKARDIIEDLPVRDVVSWNSLISGYVQRQREEDALKCFQQMQCEGLCPDTTTLICMLKACGATGEICRGEQIHDEITFRDLLKENVMLGNALIDMYAKCGELGKAQQVFDELLTRDVVSWNALISGYCQQGSNEDALKCFGCMRKEGFCPNTITYICILRACGIDMGKRIHHEIIHKNYSNHNVELSNALISMYAKCGEIEKAQEVFDEVHVWDIVSWNVLIAGYLQQGEGNKAVTFFKRMRCDHFSPTAITLICILKACSSTGDLNTGKQIHIEIANKRLVGKVLELDTALVDMYAKCGQVERAQKVLEELPLRDVASWNAVISGYSQCGLGQEVMNLFQQMQKDGLSPDVITFVNLLKACGSVSAIDKGIEIHNEIRSKGLLGGNIELGNALVGMYAKCGDLEKAQKTFDSLPNRDVISWNALISGYAEKGHANRALECFKQMQFEGRIVPDAVTFLCLLNACSRSGYVNEGKYHFENMSRSYGITPDLQHYTCMVDLFGRIGKFDEVITWTKDLPAVDHPFWCAFLGACQKWDNVKLGRLAFEKAVQLDDTHGAAYMHLANMYAAPNMQKKMKGKEAEGIGDNRGNNV